MCRFILEVRCQDGNIYPAESLRQLCIAIWRYLRDCCRRYDLNFLDRSKAEFADIRECLDSKMKSTDLESPHIKKQAEPVSSEEEDLLWLNAFSKSDAESLQYAVYFYSCELFGLRAADEHANLDAEQFQFGSDELGQYIRFIGCKSKTVQGGIFHKKVDPKDIKHYADETNPRCIVQLFRKYIELIPRNGPFYRRPLVSKGSNGQPRFSQQKVGVHSIQKYMERMCALAGIKGYKTGHSGKVTTATTLYNKGFDEQLTAGRTGHRSTAIRNYKRTSNEQIKAISDALQPPLPKAACTSGSSGISAKAQRSALDESCTEINVQKNGMTTNKILKSLKRFFKLLLH